MTDVQRLAAEEAQHWFDFRCHLFTMKHGEYQQFKMLVAQFCRAKAEQVIDPVLLAFLEEDPWFKPTPFTLQMRQSKQVLDDPETMKQLLDLEKKAHANHLHGDDGDIDLKDLKDDA